MTWAAVAGAGVVAAGSLYSADQNQKQAGKQKKQVKKYQQAYNQYADLGQQESDQLSNQLQDVSHQRYGQYGDVGQQMYGAPAIQAGEQGRQDYLGGYQNAMAGLQPGMLDNRTQTPSALKWRGNADQTHAAQLAAQQAALGQAGQQQGVAQFQQNLGNQLAEGDVNRGRITSSATQRAGLLQAYRDRKVQDAAMKFQYMGPGNGYYNAALASQLAQLGGNAALGYANGQAGNRNQSIAGANTYGGNGG